MGNGFESVPWVERRKQEELSAKIVRAGQNELVEDQKWFETDEVIGNSESTKEEGKAR